jgi:8-oxo-dGTP pyrophosphatase MutT (NUDIX family)
MKNKLVIFLFAILSLAMPLNSQMVFKEKPKDFTPKMEVASCFIRVDERILFLKRLPTKPQGNTWCMPGGKFDPGETASETVIRETFEETGIQIPKESLHYFGPFYIRYPDMDYTFHMFEYQMEQLPEVHCSPAEHTDYRWVTLEEALQLPLIPGQEECMHLVYGDILNSSIGATG